MTTPTATTQPEQMLTLREVAGRLRVSEMTVRRLIKESDDGTPAALASVKIGRARRVRESVLNAYVRSLTPAA